MSKLRASLMIGITLTAFACLALLAAPGYGATLYDDAVSYWKLDEESGGTASDSKGSNEATVNGASWTSSGRVNGASGSDGFNDYLKVPDDDTLDIANGITVSAWVKADTSQANTIVDNSNVTLTDSNVNLETVEKYNSAVPISMGRKIVAEGPWTVVSSAERNEATLWGMEDGAGNRVFVTYHCGDYWARSQRSISVFDSFSGFSVPITYANQPQTNDTVKYEVYISDDRSQMKLIYYVNGAQKIDTDWQSVGLTIPDTAYFYYGAHDHAGTCSVTYDDVNDRVDVLGSHYYGGNYGKHEFSVDTLTITPVGNILNKGGEAYSLSLEGTTLKAYINGNELTATIASPTDWHYYTLTYNGSTLALWVDGALADSTSVSGSITLNSEALKIGDLFNGTLDEVAVWGRALTSGEIASLYNTAFVSDAINTTWSLDYSTDELNQLADLYYEGKYGSGDPIPITINGTTWQYYATLPDQENHEIGDAYTYDGKKYIYLGSGVGEGGEIPEPATVAGIGSAIFVFVSKRFLKRRSKRL